MRPVLLFADRLPPLVGGMEMHARYFIEHFHGHPRFPLVAVVTRDGTGRDCLRSGTAMSPVALSELPGHLSQAPAVLFFNSGRWIEDLSLLREVFPDATTVYRTGGNEILKAPLERQNIEVHAERQAFWVAQINACIDHLITNSAFTDARLLELGVERQRLVRCVGGVNTRALLSGSRRSDRAGPPIFLSAARFVPYKNHDRLLEVFHLLSSEGFDFRLRLAGDGPLQGRCREQVQQLGLTEKVAFLGALPNEQICEELLASDYYIQFSSERVTSVPGGRYVHAEGMGRSILEAISCGTFVVATRTGALPEVVTPERGLLLELGAPRSLARALMPLFNAPPPRPPATEGYGWDRYSARSARLWEGSHAPAAGH
jgi:glycosyltransferase involved in cell wall biosynthesis